MVTQNRNMRSLLTLLSLLTVLAGSPQAQDFKPFQFYLTTGPQPSLSNGDVGVTFTLEPAYQIGDNISVGLRLQVGGFSRAVEGDVEGSPYSIVRASVGNSVTLNGKYYFTTTSFRPYVGFGLGLYSLKSLLGGGSTDDSLYLSVEDANKFGFYPRIGFDWWQFNFNVDLNLVGPTDAEVRKSGVFPGERSRAATTTAQQQPCRRYPRLFLVWRKTGLESRPSDSATESGEFP